MAHCHRYTQVIEKQPHDLSKALKTWEDPTCLHSETGARGDNDPIDAIEIGEGVAKRGEVKQVKVLGIMAMLDQGETDWKVVVIDTKDPMAAKLNGNDDG